MSYGSGVPEYSRPLLERDVAADPFAQFGRWYRDASQVTRVPEAVAVATASLNARPSVRMVLMKGWDERGFVFYSSGESRKGFELKENPVGALLFHWDQLGRQVRIEGPVAIVTDAESDAYFASRPLGAQTAASISDQSRGHQEPGGARRAHAEGTGLLSSRTRAKAPSLGRIPSRARGLRVLAEPGRPAP